MTVESGQSRGRPYSIQRVSVIMMAEIEKNKGQLRYMQKSAIIVTICTVILIGTAAYFNYSKDDHETTYILLCIASPFVLLTLMCSLITSDMNLQYRLRYIGIAFLISGGFATYFWIESRRYFESGDDPIPRTSVEYLPVKDFDMQEFWISIHFSMITQSALKSTNLTELVKFRIVKHRSKNTLEPLYNSTYFATLEPQPLRLTENYYGWYGNYAQDCLVRLDYSLIRESLNCKPCINCFQNDTFYVPGTNVQRDMGCDLMEIDIRVNEKEMLLQLGVEWSNVRAQIQYTNGDIYEPVQVYDLINSGYNYLMMTPSFISDDRKRTKYVVYEETYNEPIAIEEIVLDYAFYDETFYYSHDTAFTEYEENYVNSELEWFNLMPWMLGTTFGFDFHLRKHGEVQVVQYGYAKTFTFNDLIVSILALSSKFANI